MLGALSTAGIIPPVRKVVGGPEISTVNGIPRYQDTLGKILKNTNVTINDYDKLHYYSSYCDINNITSVSGSATANLNTSDHHRITLTENTEISFSNVSIGQEFWILVYHNNYLATFPAEVTWDNTYLNCNDRTWVLYRFVCTSADGYSVPSFIGWQEATDPVSNNLLLDSNTTISRKHKGRVLTVSTPLTLTFGDDFGDDFYVYVLNDIRDADYTNQASILASDYITMALGGTIGAGQGLVTRIYSGELRVYWYSTEDDTLRSRVIIPHSEIRFTADGNYYYPLTRPGVYYKVLGGGGGGAGGVGNSSGTLRLGGSGGGGGAALEGIYTTISSTIALTVGAATSNAAAAADGADGNESSFANIFAYGGGGGKANNTSKTGGAGGGIIAKGDTGNTTLAVGGRPAQYVSGYPDDSGFGGGTSELASDGGSAVNGGGAGGAVSTTAAYDPGASIKGGFGGTPGKSLKTDNTKFGAPNGFSADANNSGTGSQGSNGSYGVGGGGGGAGLTGGAGGKGGAGLVIIASL